MASAHVEEEARGLRVSPSHRHNSVSEIVQSLVQGIAASGLAPGDKLPPERRLSEMLGVGRSVLREALKSLDVLGFIEIRQGDGTYLATNPANLLPQVIGWGILLQTPEAQQLIEARLYIESACVRLAAVRSSNEDRAAMWSQIDMMERATHPVAFADADSQFHFVIARAAHNTVLLSVLENTKSLLHAWMARVVEEVDDRSELIRQHTAIAEALDARDADAASAAMEGHIAEVTRLLQKTLPVG